MNNNRRSIIFNKVVKSLKNIDNACQQKIMSELWVKLNKGNNTYSFVLPLKTKNYNIQTDVHNIKKIDLENTFDDIIVESNAMCFNVLRDKHTKAILESNLSGVTSPLLVNNNKNIIVEFSSPNIAKPFHMGHLRSTIIGNYISNINNFLQNKIKRINYLGDWGTQLGLIQVGMEIENIGNEMQTDPIKAWYKAYVTANKLAETDNTITERARRIFELMESEDDFIHKKLQTYRNYTVQELEETYKRIGVVFDEYHWESMYTAKRIHKIINLMEQMKLLVVDEMNRKVMPLNEKKNIPIIKSDGTTLYIARDIAAAIDRFEKNEFDSMYYVVDNSQIGHFSNLVEILNKMQVPWADRLKHVMFGRICEMSTRKGMAVSLKDILNEAREVMREQQMHTATTKVSLDKFDDKSTDILGVSGVIIEHLRRKRMKNYKLNWNVMCDMKGDSGVKLQYTHCRLCNLECNSGATLITECDPSLLKEAEVDDLVILISKFDEVILKSYEELEPCILTIYLFHLCNAVSKAMKELRIKGVQPDLANQRLLLFRTSKVILAQGMKILGLTPLEKM